jgi:outer membrane protein assembly factor BamB
LVIDQVVIVGDRSGNVYAVDANNGTQIWSGNAGAQIPSSEGIYATQPQSGLGAGEGYLVVPAGNVLTAWRITGP